MLLVSRAPVEKLQAYKKRMGWGIEWVSAGGSDFNRDLGFTHTEEELRPFLEGEIPPTVKQMAERSGTDVAGYVAEGPGLSAYALSDGTVYRTYVTSARGLEPAMAYYGLLDRTPMGRNEGDECPSGSGATTSTRRARRPAGRRDPRGSAPVGDEFRLLGPSLFGQPRRRCV